MVDIFTNYGYTPDKTSIDSTLNNIAANVSNVVSEQAILDCFSCMDLTTLQASDTNESVVKLVEKVNTLAVDYPSYPSPASICVYPNFASVVKSHKKNAELNVTTVASCFPSAQSFLEVKIRECELAVENGADEIDIVLALNSFLAGDYDTARSEIRLMKEAIDKAAAKQNRKVILKVILEGADFIKTSTGKVEVNATPMSAYIMCECIKKFYEKTGRKVGFKAAGGVSSTMDAIVYYSIVSYILGKEWLVKALFRLGVSRLANSLMSSIEQKTIVYF